MRSQWSEDPRLFVVKAQELPLSGQALLELMRAVLDKGVPFRFCARGWSMAPFIRDSDIITVAPLGEKMAGVGEVAAFIRSEDGKLVVHRVVSKQETGFTIQGDNTSDCVDDRIPFGNVLGRVVRIERKGRRVWLGLGPERFLIAWLSRLRLLIPIQLWLAACRKRLS